MQNQLDLSNAIDQQQAMRLAAKNDRKRLEEMGIMLKPLVYKSKAANIKCN